MNAQVGRTRPHGVIKKYPEDFVVREWVDGAMIAPVFNTSLEPPISGYSMLAMTKLGMPGEAALREVARQLGVPRSHVSDHGLKDSWALTTQFIVVEGNYIPRFAHKKIWLRYLGVADGPLVHGRTGLHQGNHFAIRVVTKSSHPPETPREFLNLFGHQRFGHESFLAGKFLLEGDLPQALRAMVGTPSETLLGEVARKYRISVAAALLHPEARFEVGFKVLQWQSHLWNMLAPQVKDAWLPMWNPDIDHYDGIWNPQRVDERFTGFLHRFNRRVIAVAENCSTVPTLDGYLHEFSLPPGSYATIYLSSMYDIIDASVSR
jgi:tRNA(Glu) U13 pseudouridine synthase TruD